MNLLIDAHELSSELADIGDLDVVAIEKIMEDDSFWLPDSHEVSEVYVDDIQNLILKSLFLTLLKRHNASKIFLTDSLDALTTL